jgi:hypothetical protein
MKNTMGFEAYITGIKNDKEMKELDVLNIDFVKYGKVCDCLGHIGITIPIEKEFLFREICYYKYNLSDKEKYKIMIIGDRR